MKASAGEGWFAGLMRRFSKWKINREIFERLFPHLNGEKDFGYPFRSDEEMNAQTESLKLDEVLEEIESQIQRMPKGYSECFRHVMHRDIQARLLVYREAARTRIRPVFVDPRTVATHA